MQRTVAAMNHPLMLAESVEVLSSVVVGVIVVAAVGCTVVTTAGAAVGVDADGFLDGGGEDPNVGAGEGLRVRITVVIEVVSTDTVVARAELKDDSNVG